LSNVCLTNIWVLHFYDKTTILSTLGVHKGRDLPIQKMCEITDLTRALALAHSLGRSGSDGNARCGRRKFRGHGGDHRRSFRAKERLQKEGKKDVD
jgi:hypothetical protein